MRATLTAMLLLAAAPAQAIECQAARSTGAHAHWSWRVIDGRRCWFVGRRGISKRRLYWSIAVPLPRPRPVIAEELPFADRWRVR